jgi:hypothetical protein
VEVVAAPVAEWHLAMELPAAFPIRPADASFVSEFFSGREAGSPLGHNPFNLAMNEIPALPLGHVVHNDAQVFEPTFVEVIEVAVRPSGVNHRGHRGDEELTIQRLGFLSRRGHGAYHTPRESALGDDPVVSNESRPSLSH